MANRKKVEEFIISYIKKLTGTDFNVKLYKDLFKSMNDKEFDKFMTRLKDKEFILPIIAPHEKGAVNINLENNIKLGKELGYNFFQHLLVGPTDTDPKRKTKYPMLIHLAPMRRMKQTIAKGLSVAEHDKTRDSLTGQVSGVSKSSSISYPELQLLISMGMHDSVNELLISRGGDEGGMRAAKQALLRYGNVSNEFVSQYKTGVTSTKTLKAYFNGMHMKINL
jgi:hypothetical protein